MGVPGSTIVSYALKHLNQEEVPLGSNTGPFVEKCQHDTFLAGTGWPWCAAFVDKVAKDAGVPLSYPSAGAHDLYDHYRSTHGVAFADAKPGDVVDFNIGSGHTGILVRKSADAVVTVDGNWNDRVTRHSSAASLIRGIWRIPGVRDAPPLPPPPKLPAWVVVTSASGHKKVVFTTQKKSALLKWLTTHNLAKAFPNGITIRRGKSQ